MSEGLSAEQMTQIVRDYDQAALVYRALAARLDRWSSLTTDARLSDQARQFAGIVHGSCVDYIRQGAQAIEEAADRMRAAAAPGAPAAPAAPATPPASASAVSATPVDVPFPALDLDLAARVYEDAAGTLYSLVQRLTTDAETVGSRALTGDTHPYGDIIYGICIPYLLNLSDALRA